MANAGTTPAGGSEQINLNTDNALEQAQGDAALAAVGGIPSASFDASTTISSMDELQKKYPQLYNLIVESIAQNMMIDLNRSEQRVEQAMKNIREGY